jgi:hypothetical protein
MMIFSLGPWKGEFKQKAQWGQNLFPAAFSATASRGRAWVIANGL